MACSSCNAKFPVQSPGNNEETVAVEKVQSKKGKAKFKGFGGGDAPAVEAPAKAPPQQAPKQAKTKPKAPVGPPSKPPNHQKQPSPPPTKPKSPPSPPPSEIELTTSVRQPPHAPPQPAPKTQPRTQSPKRSVKRATFVTVDPAETNIHLGDDGKLPELVLNKTAKPEDEETADSSGKPPWVMIAALVGSLGVSVLLLFAPIGGGSGETREQKSARDVLKDYYISNTFNPNAPLEDYQNVLRQAIQAHDRGDLPEERRLYRQTLDMLASEDLNEHRGLTGVPSGEEHPSDPMLRKLLAELLKQ